MNRNQALDRILAEAGRGELIFPTNMAASLRLQEALSHPDCHLGAAADMVLAEPLIAARLVAIANSVAYTRFGGHISNVRTAVSLLGFTPLKSLVAAIVVRQLASAITDPALKQKADQLWHHCANVAALAKIIAREFSSIDPETALFAGIVHEIDGFYLLSRAKEFPELLVDEPAAQNLVARSHLAHAILHMLKVPKPVASAVEFVFSGESATHPALTAGDVLVIANTVASTPSPLFGAVSEGLSIADMLAYEIDGKSLGQVLDSASDEIKRISDALLA